MATEKKSSLKDEVSKKIGLFIREDGWDDAFKAADVQGKIRLDPKVKDVLIIMLKHIEELEKNASF